MFADEAGGAAAAAAGGDGDDDDDAVAPDSSARRWSAGGGARALDADLAGLRRHGYSGVWRVSSGSEVCVAVAVPHARLGLSTEIAHSLHLEPDSTVVVKLRAQVDRPWACSSVLLEPGSDRRLPMIRFTVLKARAGDAVLDQILRRRAADDAAAVAITAEFGMRYSLQNLLQTFFVQMLAAETEWHKPNPIARGCSYSYVRNLVTSGLQLDSDEYMSAECEGRKGEALKAAIAESETGPRSAQMHEETREKEQAQANHLLRLVRFVRQQLELSSQYCMVCHVPTTVRAIKPYVCAGGLCLHQWGELSLGANPELEIKQNPEVVDLLLSLFYKMAVGGSFDQKPEANGLVPTWAVLKGWVPCTGLLVTDAVDKTRIIGTDTCFVAQLRQGDSIRVTPIARDGRRLPEQVRRVKSVEADESLTLTEPFIHEITNVPFHRMRDDDESIWDVGFSAANIMDGTAMRIWCRCKRYDSWPAERKAGHFGGMPPVKKMRRWIEAGDSLRGKLDEIDGRLYPLLRWVLCSMRGHLRYVDDKSDESIPQLAHMRQFVMLCSKPETESEFQELAKNNDVKYAFHGSPVANWHSILRTGLNFAKTSHGRAYGNGIYMAVNSATSMGYSGGMVGRQPAGGSARKGSGVFTDCFKYLREDDAKLVGGALPTIQEGAAAGGATGGEIDAGWASRSMFGETFNCLAVCEVIYRPSEFVSTSPHWVVDKLSWVVTRYLCVHTPESQRKWAAAAAAAGQQQQLAQPHHHRMAAMAGVAADSLQINRRHIPRKASEAAAAAAEAAASPSGLEAETERGLYQMFPQFEPAMIRSVLSSVNGDTDEAVLVLSSMAAQQPASSRPEKKREREDEAAETIDLTDDGEPAAAGAAAAAPAEASAAGGAAGRVAAAQGAADDTLSHLRSPPSHLRDEPAAKLVEEVLEGTAAMGLTLERTDAIRLLRGHHNHVSDAIAAAFG